MKIHGKPIILVFIQLLLFTEIFGQKPDIQRINPTNWWVGMKNPNLQILLYGKNIASHNLTLKPYAGVKIKKINKVENPNYLFVDLAIAKTAKAGKLDFTLGTGVNATKINYELKTRTAKLFSNGDE